VRRAFQQIILICAWRRNPGGMLTLDHDVACGAGTATAAKRQQIINAAVTQRFHQVNSRWSQHLLFGAIAADDTQIYHYDCS
jgi:hypothetical protein